MSIATNDRPAGRVLWSLPEGRGGNHHCRSRFPFQHQNGGLTTAWFHFLLPCLQLNWLSQGNEKPGKGISKRGGESSEPKGSSFLGEMSGLEVLSVPAVLFSLDRTVPKGPIWN